MVPVKLRSLVAGLLLALGGATGASAACSGQFPPGLLCANVGASLGQPNPVAITSVLDTISTTQGSVLYRGAVGWSALAPGASGQILTTLGAGANPAWTSAAGTGSVTSVALVMPSIFAVTGSPVTSSGILTTTLNTQTANVVFAGPGSGGAATPTFRALVGADLPNPASSTLGGVRSLAAVTSKWINTISTSGIPTATQPAFTDISGNASLVQLPSIANNTVIGNNSGGTATPTALTASNVLDMVGTTQGSVLYRNASVWTPLTPGTNGQVLTSGGAAANPSWTTVSGTGTVTSVATGAGLTGGAITTTGTIAFAAIANNTVLANVSGGSLAPSSTTPTLILDVIGATQGQVLYRGASAWTALAPGTSGQVLQTLGAGSSPQWASIGGVSNVVISAGTGISVSGTCNITTSGTCTIANTGVLSIATNTGAFTLNASKGITNATNAIQTTFTQTGTGAVATDLVARTKELPVTPWDFTSAQIDDGVTDATTAIQLALNTGKDVYLPKPASCYRVTSDLTMAAQQEIYGDGRGEPTICVKAIGTFTNGLFNCNTNQPGNTFRDMAVTYTQPSLTMTFSGAISGTTLTVTSFVGGSTALAVGQYLYSTTGGIAVGTKITALGSGTGGNGTYTVGVSQTLAIQSMSTPDALRAQLTQYRPTWACSGAPRASIRHMLVQGAWNGADFTANSGGLEILDLQMSSFGYGISLDGSLDTIRINDFHFWPYGLTTDQYAGVFGNTSNGSTPGVSFPVGILAGRVDGLYISGMLNISWQAMYTFHGVRGGGLAGDCQCYVENSDFDSFNGANVTSGFLHMNNVWLTTTTLPLVSVSISGTNTRSVLSNIHFVDNSSTSQVIMQACTTCSLTINGFNVQAGGQAGNTFAVASSAVDSTFQLAHGYIDLVAAAQQVVLAQAPSSGANNIHLSDIMVHTTAGTAYASPIFDIQGGATNRTFMTGLRANDKGAGGGIFISLATDCFCYISGNMAPGWSINTPVATLGFYSNNPH